MKNAYLFGLSLALLVAACQTPQPVATESEDGMVRVQYNGGERYEAVFATAEKACAARKQEPVLVGTRCLETICVNKETQFRCE